MLTIILPTYNEMKNPLFKHIMKSFQNLKNSEIIIVDYNSNDGTKELVNSFQFKLIQSPSNSRASRLNEGIAKAKGDLTLLHHPRSLIQIEGLNYLADNAKKIQTWGAFHHKFDTKHPLLFFTSFWSNYIRGKLFNVFYLDHCLFAPTNMFKDIGFVPEVDIFEDTLLSYKLRRKKRALKLNYTSTTSAVRFNQNGIYKQALKNQILKWKFYFGQNDKKMNQGYEKNLNLNSTYEGKNNE